MLRRGWFVQTGRKNVRDFYDFDSSEQLGEGAYGQVVKATHRASRYMRAIKIVSKEKVHDQSEFVNEVEILKRLDHPNIIRLYETFEDDLSIFLVFELCLGGELFDRIIDKVAASQQGFFSEEEARDLFTQIMRGLNYCHKNGVIHRDIKPENLIFSSTAPNSMLKVIDFGLSKLCKTDEEVIQEAKLRRANSQAARPPRKKVTLKTVAGTVAAK